MVRMMSMVIEQVWEPSVSDFVVKREEDAKKK